MTYFFDCYHAQSCHRLRKVYKVEASHLEEAVDKLAAEDPNAKPFACRAESGHRYSQWMNLDSALEDLTKTRK